VTEDIVNTETVQNWVCIQVKTHWIKTEKNYTDKDIAKKNLPLILTGLLGTSLGNIYGLDIIFY
jgi:hypothetical protein